MFTFPGTAMSTSIPSSPYAPMLYSNSGTQDTNGLFYALGSNFGAQAWSNPNTSGLVNLYTSGTPTSGALVNLVDRDVSSATQCVAANTAGNYFAMELPSYYFIIQGYLFRNRTTATGSIRNWSIQGSANTFAATTVWDTVASYSSNATLTTASQYAYFPVTNSLKYKTYRVLSTGTNSSGTNALALGEIELYGYLYTS